ncbi:MAG TPA: glycosyl hydrolase [Sulfuricurvum sp.]|nr:MAG: glycosyl hydrolase [Campylobacterales bacterium 16-40-21]OZA02880.1 MAG: glycosyl hydrolase [Sulfuricurvum sp. 17-40-25]HQS67162.1 glycosyl hydrolase [Sulfuricurvum sp.]HQT36398.1 glycosyl hydrolase [Sulfuricurvum sp.]
MKEPFAWDHYSDQPAIIRDKALKRKMRRSALFSLIKTFLISLIVLPIAYIVTFFLPRKKISGEEFFGMGVNLNNNPALVPEYINELGVKKLLVRIALWEMDRLDEYVAFIDSLQEHHITVAILQDREHITDLNLTKVHLSQIFTALEHHCNTYVIGSTINRAKWGFFSVNEYLKFYSVAYSLKKELFPNLKFIGSQTIDFELHFTTHTLFNLQNIYFDALGTLLYVDRRGAPENTQMGFNLMGKINLIDALMRLSFKTANELIITETNWPIKNTAPYAPTSEYECVDEAEYTNYMIRYHLLAFATQKVTSVYWHQLIAPGYGLIDNREGVIIKRNAFYAYQTMFTHLGDATFDHFSKKNGAYHLICSTPRGSLTITWDLHSTPIYTYKA